MGISYPSYARLFDAVAATGLWDNDRHLGPHRFRLAPLNYHLTTECRDQLNELSAALYDVFGGISQMMAEAHKQRQHGGPKGALREVSLGLRRSAPYFRIDHVWPLDLPALCKTDLVVGIDGHLWIAEADATNPRSLGNAIVRRRLSETIAPQAARLQGIVSHLVSTLELQGASELLFLYADRQRFYAPEFRVVQAALAEFGIDLVVKSEHEVVAENDRLVDQASGRALPTLLMDLPAMGSEIVRWFKDAVPRERVRFLIPPHNFLASKVLLGYISNLAQTGSVEALLAEYIRPASLAVVRRHLPSTLVIPKGTDWKPRKTDFGGTLPIIKQGFASGTRGIWFPPDDGYAAATRRAIASTGDFYIAQHEVPQRTDLWLVYPEDGCGDPDWSGDWRARLTAYMTPGGVVEVAATARQGTPLIHGNADAIQAGVVFG